MNYTTTACPSASIISLPPISTIDPQRQRASPPPTARHYHHQQPPYPISRHLPAPGAYPHMPPNVLRTDGMPARAIYPGGSAYHVPSARMPLPPTTDPNLMIAGRPHQKKEVKRRTKTGCQTCRKRRIKCDEARPECRNCQKSKRECLGYDQTTFRTQSTPPLPIQSAPTAYAVTDSSQLLGQQYPPPPITSPSLSSNTPSVNTESSLDPRDYPIPNHESTLPPLHYHRPHPMDAFPDSRDDMSSARSYSHSIIRRAIPRTVEELCTIDGNRRPNLPPLPKETPNLDAIQTIYDSAFAPGLDRLLETRWYSRHGFELLVADRGLLAQFLAYITLIHNSQEPHHLQGSWSAALASQEARITWELLKLCAHLGESDGDADGRTLVRRYHILQALLTAEPVKDVSLFTPDDEGNPSLPQATALQKTFVQRSADFWTAAGRFVSLLNPACPELVEAKHTSWPEVELAQAYERREDLENRDIIVSIMHMHLLGLEQAAPAEVGTPPQPGSAPQQRWNACRELLETEASGQATNLVLSTVCGIALRAWDWDY